MAVNATHAQVFEMLGRAYVECQILTKQVDDLTAAVKDRDAAIDTYRTAYEARKTEVDALANEVNRLRPLVPKRHRGG